MSQWIWHQGEFEYYIYDKVMFRRRERNVRTNPVWELPSVSHNARFFCRFNLKKDATIRVTADGDISARVDESPVFLYEFNGEIELKSGEHILLLEVYNEKGVPCIYPESKDIEDPALWSVSIGAEWTPAAFGGFYDINKKPSEFCLPVKKTFAVSEEELTSLNGRKGVLYDFGKEMLAFPAFKNVKKGGTAELYYGESREEALDTEYSETLDTFTLEKGDFKATLSKAFRYVFVKTQAIADKFFVYEEYYPKERRSYFESDDKLLNEVYKVSLYTMELTSRELFLDGIKRDRWVWAGDTLQSELMTFYSFFDKELIKRTLTALAGKNSINQHINGIMDYSFYVIIGISKYYEYTGDIDFLRRIFPRIRAILDYCLSRRNERGFMQKKIGDWVFIDWADFPTDNEVCAEQMLFAESLKRAREICAAIDVSFPEEWQKALDILNGSLDRTFWTENGYAHDDTKTLMTRYGGIFAVLFGRADEEKRRVILKNTLLSEKAMEIKTPYMKFYEASALGELGAQEEVLNYIRAYWGGMLKEGATAFWEEYDPSVKGAEKYAMYGRKYGKSLCHAWGAGPLYLIGRFFVGLKPIGIGYKRFSLTPHLNGIKYRAKLPAGDGDVEVFYDGNSLRVYSSETDGELYVYGKKYEISGKKEFVLKTKDKKAVTK